METIIQPYSGKAIGDFLKEALNGVHGNFNTLKAAVAFVKNSGVRYLSDDIRQFLDNGGYCRWVIGIDQYGTSIDGLTILLETVEGKGEIYIYHDENDYVTFHPKLYLFEGQGTALLIIGSGNLTEGGLYINDEGFAVKILDLSIDSDKEVYSEVNRAFDAWSNTDLDTVCRLEPDFLRALIEFDYIRSEEHLRQRHKRETFGSQVLEDVKDKPKLFGSDNKRRKPPWSKGETKARKAAEIKSTTDRQENIGFVMTLMRTDVGVGQTTKGTSRRSPEIFVPLRARDANPDFWDWPHKYSEDPRRKGKFDRLGVKMRLGGGIIIVNIMTWPVKYDFRLRSESLRSAGEVGDIIRIEKTDVAQGYDYYVEIVPPQTNDYEYYSSLCVNKTRNSKRMWGYY